MNTDSLWFALALVALVVCSGVVAAAVVKNTENRRDSDVSAARVKHHLKANPILWMYALFPVAIIAGIWLIYVWLR
jgi:uncharacterized membrane protein